MNNNQLPQDSEVYFYYKNEIAERIGISISSLRHWLNVRYIDELEKLGYYLRQKKITHRQFLFLMNKLMIE